MCLPADTHPETESEMSTNPSTRGSHTEQQTLAEATASERIQKRPTGIILRAELPSGKFEEFLQNNTMISWVMVNFRDAQDVIDTYGTLDAVIEPWQTPIVTATDPDEIIQERTRDTIRSLLREIQPAVYVPDNGTVYIEDTKQKQEGGIEAYKIRLDWLVEEIETQGYDIQLLPLAKGQKQWHFEKYLDLFEKHDFENYAFYTRQYCGGSVGNRINDLLDSMHNFITVVEPDNVLAIARHGEAHLRKFPPEITGATGLKQLVSHCTKSDGSISKEMFPNWRSRRREVLFANHDIEQLKLGGFE